MNIPQNPFNVSASISHFPGFLISYSIAHVTIRDSSKVSSKNMPRKLFEWKTCERIHRSSWTGHPGHRVHFEGAVRPKMEISWTTCLRLNHLRYWFLRIMIMGWIKNKFNHSKVKVSPRNDGMNGDLSEIKFVEIQQKRPWSFAKDGNSAYDSAARTYAPEITAATAVWQGWNLLAQGCIGLFHD